MRDIMRFELITEDEINTQIASIQTELDDIDKIELETKLSMISEFLLLKFNLEMINDCALKPLSLSQMMLTKRKRKFSMKSGDVQEKKENKYFVNEKAKITEIHRFTFGPYGNSVISSERSDKDILKYQ